jgi:hypothetical protein
VPLYEITESGLRQHAAAGFATLGLYERADLQRLLREDISAVGDDLLVIAEEFGQWEDARRRIDLLAIDKAPKEALRCLKRRLSDAVYRCLLADQRRQPDLTDIGLAGGRLVHNYAQPAPG